VHPSLAALDHRPWPLPKGPWLMAMNWHDLLFAHWRVPVQVLRPLVPSGLEIDTFDGSAWIAVVPFRMSGVRARGTPAVPGPGAFPELNVRTYVRHGTKPGVWFFSLDAASRLAVRGARLTFHLPYFDADMRCDAAGDDIAYRSRRTHRGAPAAEFAARYGPAGPEFRSAPGSLEAWLTERYCLYAAKKGGTLLRGEIHHATWPLQPARASIDANTMTAAAGVPLPADPPHLLFVRRIDVVGWAPVRARG
jgi:uncharacterized protein YqjF (DUF2071 family)